jgi:Family of unknown function (DUF6603)
VTFLPELDRNVVSAATAVGLLDADGQIVPEWFSDPMARLRQILLVPTQRQAALELLNDVLPPESTAVDGESWHPILGGRGGNANLFVTEATTNGKLSLGLAARVHGPIDEPDPLATLEVRAPLVIVEDGAIVAAAASGAGAVRAVLRVRLDWQLAGDAIAARALRFEATVAPLGSDAGSGVAAIVEGVDFGDGNGPSDRALDPSVLGIDAVHVLLGLVKRRLQEAAASLSGPAGRVASHALPLLGFDAALPHLPLDELADDRDAARRWLRELAADADGPRPLGVWLDHLVRLLGGAGLADPLVAGTEAEPLRALLLELQADGSRVDLLAYTSVAADGVTRLQLGFELGLVPPGADPALRATSRVVLVSIPLQGTAPSTVLPRATLTMESPGDPAEALITGDAISVASLRAGIVYEGATGLQPLLELVDVSHGGVRYPTVDLSSADAVVAAAGAAVRGAILQAVGASPAARNLAALAGLVPPSGDPTWPHSIDLATLAADPARAVANVHLSALSDPAHGWDQMFAELTALVGIDEAVQGAGSEADPWHVELDSSTPIKIQLVAWDARPTDAAPELHKLRIGLRAVVEASPWNVAWQASLLAYDSVDGRRILSMVGEHRLVVAIEPIPEMARVVGVSLSADALKAELTWKAGSSVAARAVIEGLGVGDEGDAVTIAELSFPSPVDDADPTSVLGIPSELIQHVLQKLLLRATFDWADTPGLIVAALFGGHGALPGMPSDWPTFANASPQDALDDPIGALRSWLGRVATGVSSEDGRPFARALVNWLGVLLSQSIRPADASAEELDVDEPRAPEHAPANWVSGSGHPDAPWAIPVAPGLAAGLELLVWLGPGGPSGADETLSQQISVASGFGTMLEAVSKVAVQDADLHDALTATNRRATVDSLNRLHGRLAIGDGIAPLRSQLPEHEAWTAGATVAAPHTLLPADADVISQTLARIDVLAPAERVVILVGPSFTDRGAWVDMLDRAEMTRAGSTSADAVFALRGDQPMAAGLAAVSVVSDHYVAELSGETTLDTDAQLEAVVARVEELRPDLSPIIVAHSTAGLAARRFAAGNATRVAGLVTLGTPHLGAAVEPLTDPSQADALRMVARLVPGDHSADPFGALLHHLLQALDGAAEGAPYPLEQFAADAELDVGGVPALAIGSRLEQTLLDWIKPRMSQRVAELVAAAQALPQPTHVAFGLRAKLALPPASTGQVHVDATIRIDTGRLYFGDDDGDDAPRRLISLRARLQRPAAWLVGSASAFATPSSEGPTSRLHWAELGMDWVADAEAIAVQPHLRLHDAAAGGATKTLVQLGDGLLAASVGTMMRANDAELRDMSSPLSALFEALRRLGIVIDDAHGDMGVSADAFMALQVAPKSFLGPRLQAALADPAGLLGFVGAGGGKSALPAGDGNVEIAINREPTWSIELATRVDAPLRIAPTATLGFAVSMALPAGLRGQAVTNAEATLQLGRARLTWSSDSGKLIVDAPPFLDALVLVPVPPRQEASDYVRRLLPSLLLSCATSALVRATLDPSMTVGPILGLLSAPGQTLSRPGALGNSDGGLSADRINALLAMVGRAAGLPPITGLRLPRGIEVKASGSDRVAVAIATTEPLGGVVSLDLGLEIDALRSAVPTGSVTIETPLPGTWPGVAIRFAMTSQGVSLVVTPEGAAPIRLLPSFSGLGDLAAGAAALLPSVLDAVVSALGPPELRSATALLALEVATALELYDEQGGFAAHAARLRELASPAALVGLGANVQANAATAVHALVAGPTSPLRDSLPGQWNAQGPLLTWAIDIAPPLGSGELSLGAGWDDAGPTLTVDVVDFQPSAAPVLMSVSAGVVGGQASCDAAVSLPLASSVGIDVTPVVVVTTDAGRFGVTFAPLGAGTEAVLSLELAPKPSLHLGPGGAAALARRWLLPLALRFALDAASAQIGDPLWAAGPSARKLLLDAGLVEETATGLAPSLPILDADELVGRILRAAANVEQPVIEVSPSLQVQPVADDGVFGVRIRGHVDATVGALTVTSLFGEPTSLQPDDDRGLTMSLFELDDDGTVNVAPAISALGLGIGLAKSDGSALVSLDGFRLGDVAASGFFAAELAGQIQFTDVGAAVRVGGLGIPLGQVAETHGNPIASGLLGSALPDPGTANGGDAAAPTPAIDALLIARAGQLHLELGGQTGALWIGVRRAFGPVYIDRVGLRPTDTPSVVVAIDGGVTVAGLKLQFDGLGVDIPLASLASPSDWSLDLAGLGASFDRAGISVRGALRKSPQPPLEYRGLLTAEVASRTFTAVGAFARPVDEAGEYASLFAFASLPIVLGGPPFFFVTGLGAGFGYNRALTPPERPADAESFPLVTAIGDARFVDDPMGALRNMGGAFEPKRGALWFAAGVRFSTFERMKSRALVYLSMDRDLDIGLLGIGRMSLPSDDAALVHVELALNAHYSHAEGQLYAEAALTDSSWLLSRDCKLTGGFAFSIWFPTGQFVLTLGGYAPSFVPPPEFPVVERLGFDWQVSKHVSIEGDCYFALTNSCVMAGGNLDADYDKGGVHAWFDTDFDILVSWDPLQYDFSFSVDVGASWTTRICFIKCVTLSFSVSVGASLHIKGPPLHGEVSVSLAVATITVSFGSEPKRIPYIEDWDVFAAKYLEAGGSGGGPVSIHATKGVQSSTIGEAPWSTAGEFVLTTETRMPAASFADFVDPGVTAVPTAARVDLAPMAKTWSGPAGVRSHHFVELFRRDGSDWLPQQSDHDHFSIEPIEGHVPEATWRFTEPEELTASANTLPAVVGLRITAVASFLGRTDRIDVDRLVDVGVESLPLPLGVGIDIPLDVFGLAAERLLELTDGSSSSAHGHAVAAVVSGELFADARSNVGLPRAGMAPIAARSARRDRSSPPRIVPLAEGLTMRPARLAAEPHVTPAPVPMPLELEAPRLRAIVPLPTTQRMPLFTRTTVMAPDVVRMAPPVVPVVLGARLLRVGRAAELPRTIAPATSRAFRHAELAGRRESVAMDARLGDGVKIPVGNVHVWELPAGRARSMQIGATEAARITQLSRSGEVIADVETLGHAEPVVIDDGAALLAIAAIGEGDPLHPARGFGAISAARAPGAAAIATGWQSDNLLVAVSQRSLLARGATVRLAQIMEAGAAGHQPSGKLVRASAAVAAQPGVETRLPAITEVVLVFLDIVDPCEADAGDLAIAVAGATLGPPRRAILGRRVCFSYQATAPTGDYIAVAIASRRGFELAGVVGVPGSADAWAARMRREMPARLVAELAADGRADVSAHLRHGGQP